MDYINQLKSEDLTFRELQDMCGPTFTKNTKWITWDQLAQYPSTRELFNGYNAVIVLLQIEGKNRNPVGHFILLLDYNNHIEHFDSYGLTMEEELAITQEQHLTRIFKEYRKPLINSTKKLQSMREDVNTCGRWTVARLMLQNLKLEEFYKLIQYFRFNTDDLVTAMTMLLQLK